MGVGEYPDNCPTCGGIGYKDGHICTGNYRRISVGIVVYTGGTFDVPHAGHAYFFKQIKELFPDSYVIVSLNTDEFVKEYKGKNPLYSYMEREYLVGMFYGVDLIIKNKGGKDSKPSILEANPNVIAIGSDWLEKDYLKQMDFTEEWLREH